MIHCALYLARAKPKKRKKERVTREQRLLAEIHQSWADACIREFWKKHDIDDLRKLFD